MSHATGALPAWIIFIHRQLFVIYEFWCTDSYLMPLYDRQAREEFRRASTVGLSKPRSARHRRYSVDSCSTAHKHPPAASPRNSLLSTRYNQQFTRDGSVSPAKPRHKRRNSLAATQWLNSSPKDMYEKLQDRVSNNDSRQEDINSTGNNKGPKYDIKKTGVLPDIGLPPGQEHLEKGAPPYSPKWKQLQRSIPPIVIEDEDNNDSVIVLPGSIYTQPLQPDLDR